MPDLLCPTLVGRDAEWARLQAALDGVGAGVGAAVALVGEAGIGKSRLAADLGRLASEREIPVLVGRAVDAGAPAPYRPLFEALAGWSRGASDAVPELRRTKELLAPIVPGWRAADEPSFPVSAMELGEALLQLLGAIADDRGCVLVLEDLHWADADTAAVVEYVVDNVAGSGVLCVMTARSEGSGPGLRVLRTLASRRAVTVLELRRLAEPEIAEMVRRCLRSEVLSGEVDAVARRFSDGLPFLVEELLASSVAGGSLVDGPDGWQVQGDAGPVLPHGFEELVRRRVAGLDEWEAGVLSAAALLGSRFDAGVLPEITGRSLPDVTAALRSGVAAQLVVTDSSDPRSFQFRHALTRDALLAQLLPLERSALAGQVLAALERHDPELAGDAIEVAASLAEEIGERDRAAHLLLVGARRASARGALSSAEPKVDRAWRLASRNNPEWAEIGSVLMAVLTEIGDVDRAIEVGGRLLADLPASADAAVIHLAMARAAVVAGRRASALQSLERARDTAGPDRVAAVAADADVIAADIATENRSYDEAEALAARALGATDPAADPARGCHALVVLGRCVRYRNVAEATEMFDRAIAIADEHGLGSWRLRALMERASLELWVFGDGTRLGAARDEVAAAGALGVAAQLDNMLGWLAIDHREPEQADTAVERGVALAQKLHLHGIHKMLLGCAIVAAAQRGDREQVALRASEARQVPGDDRDLALIEAWARVELCVPRDDLGRLAAELDATMDLRRQLSDFPIPVLGPWALVRAYLDRDAEAALAELAADSTMVHVMSAAHWRYAHAIVVGRAGDGAQAAREVAAGDAVASPLGWFQHYARRLVAEAALADGWGEPVEWLRQALAEFERRGQDELAASCRRLLSRAGAPVPRRVSKTSAVPEDLQAMGITAREVEVLELLAVATPTREVAERLFLSPRTVERHISNLAVKVGVAGRAGVVAFAAARFATPTG
ncbi:MAG TPA: AAA family ATPase [Acidimicrobiales bacterium]|jgi:DNA-binding CsgD family transcriptional regulator/tetratricopeptide (TPR) repeat protein|nr:AAA family ATPase [Acidimicrobiales bacterium]